MGRGGNMRHKGLYVAQQPRDWSNRTVRFHVVCREGPGWGLHRIASSWADAMDCNVSREPNLKAGANAWVGYGAYAHYLRHHKSRRTGFDAVLFTHRPEGKNASWGQAARAAHLCICQSERYLKYLPTGARILLPPGFHRQFDSAREPRFLVIMATHKSKSLKRISRKRLDWFDLLREVGGTWKLTAGKYSYADLVGLVDWSDYVVILSDMEGGPLVLGEAMARHKPVIAPDVGYCWRWPVIRYTGFDGPDGVLCVVQRLLEASSYAKSGDAAAGRRLRTAITDRVARRK